MSVQLVGHRTLRELEPRVDGTRKLLNRMSYVPRGTVTERHGIRFGGPGGAYSVDRQWRTEGKDLWADLEEPTAVEAEHLVASGPVDVLLMHDAPASVNGLEGLPLPAEIAAASEHTRGLLQRTTERLQPTLVFSGQWHQRRTQELFWSDGSITTAHVLSHDGCWRGNTVLVQWEDGSSPTVTPLNIHP